MLSIQILLTMMQIQLGDMFILIYKLIITKKTNFRSRFIAAAPTSAIALHSLGRNLPTNQSSVILAENTQLSRLNVSSHPLSVYLQNYPVMNMGDCCKESFSKLSTDFYEVLYRSQKDKSFWDHCRQYRTTGSRC